MGLDMYLTGNKYYSRYDNPPKDEEGYDITDINVHLGYWRKHANLHGYIVNTFAEGNDECQGIELSLEDLGKILEAVKDPVNSMEKTEGFFFGESANDQAQIDEDVGIITKAIGFLSSNGVTGQKKKEMFRSVIYRASW